MTISWLPMRLEDGVRIFLATVYDRRGRVMYQASGPRDVLREDIDAMGCRE